jgi:hypothetical protein
MFIKNKNIFTFVFVGGSDGMAGFVDFMYKSIVPACLMAPMKPTFDFNDGQTTLVSVRTLVFVLYKNNMFNCSTRKELHEN